MNASLATGYSSAAQCARVVTESWAAKNLFCIACPSDYLQLLPRNTRAYDLTCPRCSAFFQLKSTRRIFGTRLTDGAYETLANAVRSGRTPNLVGLRYDMNWSVSDLFVVPQFALTLSCLQKRPPLSPEAQRAGWIGCNILLANIPIDARISVIKDGHVFPASIVRKQYRRIKAVSDFRPEQRGWLLDVLATVRSFGVSHFALADVYSDFDRLSALHPENHHVFAKIRQQLQRLRDMGLVRFSGSGRYELLDA